MPLNSSVLGELAFIMQVGPCGLTEAIQVQRHMHGQLPADTIEAVVDQVRMAIIEVRSDL